jgi:LuxR family maltose regulon positive regulatory protein
MRLFLNLGRPLRRLLERSAAADASLTRPPDAPIDRITGDYIRAILDAFRQESQAIEIASQPSSLAEALMDPLTERELDVLRLLAEGLSNKAIAGRLVVAPSTVKQHLKNVYGKLQVHSRTQAVVRARELDLL